MNDRDDIESDNYQGSGIAWVIVFGVMVLVMIAMGCGGFYFMLRMIGGG
jgi:hypothetical protein